MAYFGGKEILFSTQLNGILHDDVEQKLKEAEMNRKMLLTGWYKDYEEGSEEWKEQNLYDFVNVFGVSLEDSNLTLIGTEKTITDVYTTALEVTRISAFDYLTSVYMPNVTKLGARQLSNNPELTTVEFGNVEMVPTTIIGTINNNITDFRVAVGQDKNLYLEKLDLTVESLERIIDNYADCTGYETPPTLSIGEKNINKLSAEYKQKLIDKCINLE